MIKILKSLNKKDYLIVLVSFMLIIFQVWLDLKLPDYMSEITRLVQSENATVSDIMRQGFYMLSCAFGSLISAIIVGYLTSKLSATLSYKIRERLFKKVNEFNMEEMKNCIRLIIPLLLVIIFSSCATNGTYKEKHQKDEKLLFKDW